MNLNVYLLPVDLIIADRYSNIIIIPFSEKKVNRIGAI